jgi:CSLREA domain-containing protein
MSKRPFLVILSLCFSMSFIAAIPAQAGTTIIVTTTNDEMNADGDCSLREAIQAANTDSAVSGCPSGNGADTIVVPAGVYSLAILQLTISSELTISGAGSANTIIDGGNHYQVFYAASSVTATISGVTIQHGKTSGVGGGGIWNYGKLQLINTTVTSNTAGYGGGIHNQSGALTLINCTVSDNAAGDAGGIENNYGGTVTLINSTVSNNQSGYNGGGFTNDNGILILVSSWCETPVTASS